MDDHSRRKQQFGRRAFVLGALSTALYSGLVARLGWLQVVNGKQYTTLSDKNRIHVNLVTPVRGYVLDRSGHMLAHNEQNFRVQIVPEQTSDIQESLDNLSTIIDLTPEKKDMVIKRAGKQARFIPITIMDNLSWDDVSAIEISLPDLAGISIDVGQKRLYPHGENFGHMVGYVGAVNEQEMTNDPVLRLPGFQIGKTGIEKHFEYSLRGRAGTKSIEVNSAGRMVRELGEQKGQIGHSVTLSIDKELQDKIMGILSVTKSASAVVMDVHTGAIYSCASHPSFDPNLFATRLPTKTWNQWLNDPGKPLNNKAISGQYPPGSTFKMVTLLAALEAGIVDRKTSFYCPGHFDVNKERFHCWKTSGHGWMNGYTALEESCDTYFYNIAEDLGIERIAKMAHRLGLGETYDLAIPGERPGLVPDKDWKRGAFGTSWHLGETIVATIGQGYILTTPLQLAVMTSRLVNGGRRVEPWFVAHNGLYHSRRRQMQWPSMGLDKDDLNTVVRGMELVMTGEDGTAKSSAITTQGMEMGGKTGTAQVKRISMAERLAGRLSQDEIIWKHRHHALFVGYAPTSNPRYACSVVVEHGGSGSGAAAPLAQKILMATQEVDPANRPINIDPIKPRTEKNRG
jgi:penicillin-binding protein 2